MTTSTSSVRCSAWLPPGTSTVYGDRPFHRVEALGREDIDEDATLLEAMTVPESRHIHQFVVEFKQQFREPLRSARNETHVDQRVCVKAEAWRRSIVLEGKERHHARSDERPAFGVTLAQFQERSPNFLVLSVDRTDLDHRR